LTTVVGIMTAYHWMCSQCTSHYMGEHRYQSLKRMRKGIFS